MSRAVDGLAGGKSERVLAVVLNWNRADLTRLCVESLLQSNFAELDIVVVDNGSTDGSAARLNGELPGIRVLRLGENRGFAAGNNAAIAEADDGYEWFLLINNDATVAADTIAELVRIGRQTHGIVTPLIYEVPSGRLWNAGARNRRLLPIARDLNPTELTDTDAVPIDYATGCVLLINRQVFEEIGLLDERYFMYYEDLDFSARARRAGIRLSVATTAVAWHAVGASLRQQPPTRRYLQYRSRVLWCRTNHGWHAAPWWLSLLWAINWTTLISLIKRDWGGITAGWRGVFAGFLARENQLPRIPRLPARQFGGTSDEPSPKIPR